MRRGGQVRPAAAWWRDQLTQSTRQAPLGTRRYQEHSSDDEGSQDDGSVASDASGRSRGPSFVDREPAVNREPKEALVGDFERRAAGLGRLRRELEEKRASHDRLSEDVQQPEEGRGSNARSYGSR